MDPIMLILIVVLFAAYYMLLIRPRRKRQSEWQTLMENLQKGDKVITIGGIYGEIDSIDEQELILRVEDGKLKLLRTSIMSKQQSE